MSEHTEVEMLDTSVSEGFGHRLKTVREEKKLSIADIAAQLHLDEDVIQALEEYNYEALPEPMFVCGYIRNYARLLNIQPAPLVDFYKNDIQGGLIPQLDVKNESRNARSYHLGKFLPILFLLVAVGVAFAGWKWWKNYSVQTADSSAASWFNFSKKSSDQDAVPGSDTVDGQEDPTQLKLPEYTEQAFLPQINESANTSSPRPVKAQPANEPVSPPAQLQKLRPTVTPAPVVQSPRLTDAAEALNENTSAQTINADSAAGTAVLSNTLPDTNTVQNTDIQDNKLVLDFSSDSWIRIRDADGNILAKDLQKKGTHLQLQGKRPYKVFLGDATGVTVRINNTVFDHSTYINEKKIARFEVE